MSYMCKSLPEQGLSANHGIDILLSKKLSLGSVLHQNADDISPVKYAMH